VTARPLLVLVGPPGSGKTTVGRVLAGRLGVGFRDTDADVEAAAGCTVAEVFLDSGEDAFRDLEAAAVAGALAEHDGVLALGGGAVLREETRRALRGHRVVHLDVGAADAARRVGLARDRPVLALNPRAQLLRLLEQRAPLYAEVRTARVATDGRTPADVAEEILVLADLPAPTESAP
jgi:shikimate kinase